MALRMSENNHSLIKLQRRDKEKDAYLLLERTVFMLNELNIPYVIDYGTLLGAYRNKGYIQGDDDVDVSVPYTHTVTLSNLDRDFLSSHRLKLYHIIPWNDKIVKTMVSLVLDEDDFCDELLSYDKINMKDFNKIKGFGLYIDIYLKNRFPSTFDEFSYGRSTYLGPSSVEEYLDSIYSSNWRKPSNEKGNEEIHYPNAVVCDPPPSPLQVG